MFESTEFTNDAVVRVIGAGDGGGNVVEHMAHGRIEGAEFLVVGTGAQALHKTAVGQTIQIGSGITKGLGAGANPEVGRNAADRNCGALRATLEGADMVFIVTGMDGGTGTGATPVVAEVAKDLDILIVAVVTRPFSFEDKKRMAFVEQGITELSKYVNPLIIVPNDRLLKVLGHDISLLGALGAANDVLKGVAQGIAKLATCPDLINVDFADVRTIMPKMGYAMTGSSVASDEDHAEEATKMAISSPLLEDIDLSNARDVLVNITAGFDLRLDEFGTTGNTTRIFASDNTTAVIGTSLDPDMNDELRVTVVMTGIGMDKHLEITLVTNKQVQQPAMGCYQQHGMAPLTQGQKPVAKVVNDNAP